MFLICEFDRDPEQLETIFSKLLTLSEYYAYIC
jgi:hypothetical protein